MKKCVNCHGCHSAAYGGCIIYKQEAKIQVIKEKSNISYQQAKELVISQAVTRNPRNVPSEIASRPFYSQVARRKNQTSSMQRPSEPAMQHQTQDPKECSIDIPAQPVPIEQTQTQLQQSLIINPSSLVSFIADILQHLTSTTPSPGSTEIFKIVSKASSTHLGYNVELQAKDISVYHSDSIHG